MLDETVERKIKALPQDYYKALMKYLNYLTEKAAKGERIFEPAALRQIRKTGLKTVGEYVKDDSWWISL
ncbi:MAG: hypothetical protein ACTTKL_08915 [Treponema sp.]